MPANWSARLRDRLEMKKEKAMTDDAKIRLTATVTGAG
jgi:hypothetical protein